MNIDACRAQIMARLRLLEQAAPSGDIKAAVGAVYAANVVAAGQGAPTTFDAVGLGEVWAGLMGQGARLSISLLEGGLWVRGDSAYTFIENRVEPLDGSEPFVGKSLLVWTCDSAHGWVCTADMCAMGAY